MNANKIFFEIYSNISDDQSLIVHIVLVDEKVFTKLTRREMFDRNMHLGCFLDIMPFESQEQAKREAIKFASSIGAREVSPDEFQAIEMEGEIERTARALRMASKMIREG